MVGLFPRLRDRRSWQPCALEIGREFANILLLPPSRSPQAAGILRSLALPGLDLLRGSDGDRQVLAQELSDAIRLLDLPGAPLRLCLPGEAVILRVLDVPRDLSEEELQEQVLEQDAELYLPFSRRDADLDYFPLGPSGEDQRQVLLVGTRKVDTDRCLELARLLGCPLQSLEPRCLASARALRPLLRSPALAGGAAILFLGTQSSELTVFREGVPLFERVLDQLGVRTLLKAAFPQVPQLPWASILQNELMLKAEVPQMEAPLQQLLRELRQSLEAVADEVPQLRVGTLFLCGPGAALAELASYLTARLGLACECPDPWLLNSLEVPQDRTRRPLTPAQLLTVVGMALKED